MNATRWIIASLAIAISTSLWSTVSVSVAQFPLVTAEARATRITESQIRQILNQMQAAANQQNADGILKYMAPDITINVTVRSGANSQALSLTRDQYRQYLQQGFEMTKSHTSRLSNLKIQVAPNGKSAIATYTLAETSTLKSQPVTFASTSNESVKFELIQGQILETSVKSTSQLSTQN